MAPAGALEQDPNSKYELRHQIGRGSFGSAFLVTNKQDKAEYVLKRVRLAKQTKWQRNSTLQERDLATSLRHPFIVPCVESWVVQNHTVNMIYAFCQNGDLSSYLAKIKKQEGQVEEGLMRKWLCQLLLALDYLQTQQVLHRDIKTSNLMLTCDSDVQLGDFGLATLMEEDGDEHKPQDTNLVGTPHYMSPELLSCKAYGFKTDVWSLGCVFYELTAQRPTFNAFNIHGLVSKIKKNKLAPLPTNYSEEWRDAIALMLCKNPEKRPSVQQLMGLPALRPAMLEARARARELMPSVPLPPLLDPTPLTPQPLLGQYRSSCSQDAADAESEGSEGNSASDQQAGVRSCGGNSDAGSSKMSSRADRCSAVGLTAAHAVQASELSELWKANFGQLQQAEEQLDTAKPEQQSAADAQLAALAQQQEVQQCQPLCSAQGSRRATGAQGGGSKGGSRSAGSTSAGGCSPADSSCSVLTPVQGAAGECRGLGVGYSPRSGLGIIDGYRRIVTPSKPGHVNQPGIKRTPSERVAAAIAAAGGSPTQAAAAGATATGRVTPDLCPRPRLDSGPSLAKTSRSSSSSQRAGSEALTPQQRQQPGSATDTPTGQSTPTDPSATPRVPSNIAKRQASITPRQDSARRHRASDCTHVHGSGAHTARPGTAPQADQQLEGTAAAPTPTKAAGTPTRPLSAPRCSSVRRGSDRGPSSSGGSKQQQRPPWGAGAVGGRSCLTPGRQRPEHSPILKAVKATNAASGAAAAAAAGSLAAAAGAAAQPAGAGILADVASTQTTRKQRRSHGHLSPVPSEKLSAWGAESPATGMECQAECGAPVVHHQQQQQQQVARRSSSSAGAAESPAHGLSRSSGHHSAGGSPQQHQEQQQQQQGQLVSGASPLHDSLPSRQPRYSGGGTALPPLPLHKLQRSSSKDGVQAPELSPIPLASPVHGQDRPAPVECTSSGSASKQPLAQALGSPFSQAAAAQQPSGSGSKKQQQQRVSSTRASDSGASDAQQSEQGATAASRASMSGGAGSAVGSGASRRASGSASSSRRSSGAAAGLPSAGSLGSRRSNSADAEQQQQQAQAQQPPAQQPMSVRTPAAGSSPMVSRRSSGNSTPKRGQQPPQPQQEQQQLVVEGSPQPQQPPYEEVMQRLELLESAMMVIGGLAARGRWTELSSVMRSEGLLPDGMMAALEAGQQQSSVLKLGDIVVLGKKRDIKGKIRYFGPVAWDLTAADWVGMELDQPRGVDATQRGITYFACPPSCASFHKASDLTTLGA